MRLDIDSLIDEFKETLRVCESTGKLTELDPFFQRVKGEIDALPLSKVQQKYAEEDVTVDLATSGSKATFRREHEEAGRKLSESVDRTSEQAHTDPLLDSHHNRVAADLVDEQQRLVSKTEVPAGVLPALWDDVLRVREALQRAELDEPTLAAFERVATALRESVGDMVEEESLPEITPEELAAIPLYPGRPYNSMEWYKEHWAPLVEAGRVWQHHVREHDQRFFGAFRKLCQRKGLELWKFFPAKPGLSGVKRRKATLE